MDEREPVDPVTIRFPRSMRQALRRSAQSHHRSFNGEVIWALQQHLRRAAAEGASNGDPDEGEDLQERTQL